jgi:hypothetical protein
MLAELPSQHTFAARESKRYESHCLQDCILRSSNAVVAESVGEADGAEARLVLRPHGALGQIGNGLGFQSSASSFSFRFCDGFDQPRNRIFPRFDLNW